MSHRVNTRKRKHSYDDFVEEGENGGQSGKSYGLMIALIPAGMQLLLVTGLLFILTYYYTQAHTCANSREVWCKDDWYCNKQTSSTDKTYNKCYKSKNNLESCLYDPKSDAAVKCIDYSKAGVACPCVIPDGSFDGTKGSSCLAGCPASLSKMSDKTVCCCVPGSKGCKNKTLPSQCH